MKYPLLALIKLYQWTISPLLGPVCKYYPSCSHYGYTAIDRHGAIKGTALTAWRILRCNPWSLGGVDHVPPRKRPRWHEMLAPGPASSSYRGREVLAPPQPVLGGQHDVMT